MAGVITSSQSTLLGLHGNPEPVGGFRCTAPIIFTADGTVQAINFTPQQSNIANFLSSLQCVWFDNPGATVLTLSFTSGQNVILPAKTQGYVNVMQPNPVSFGASAAVGAVITLIGINAQMPAQMWTRP